jgi:ketosteroid isomerase-like protein
MVDSEIEQRIRAGFERWNSGDHTFDPSGMDPDVEFHTASASLMGGVYRGLDGVARWVADMEEVFDEWQLELDTLEEAGPGRLLGVGTLHLRGRGSRVTVDQPCAWLFEHADGKLTRFEPFPNRVEDARRIASRSARA